MSRYEVIASRRWVNTKTGATASIYGAAPYVSAAEKADWVVQVVGYTVLNIDTGTVGIGRKPWDNALDAQGWCDTKNAEHAASVKNYRAA